MKKVTKKNGRDKKTGRFLKSNQIAVKWTEKTIIPELNKILVVLGTDDSGDNDGTNLVRANDIKYAEEAVMCANVPLTAWDYWNSAKFAKSIKEDSSVFLLIKKIKKICELRLSYSGQVMDLFHLKNHYGYKDKTETDITTGGDKINETKTKIDLSGIPVNVLKMLREKVAAK